MAHLALQTGTFAAAEALLAGRDSRKIGHNTRLARIDSDTIAVRYHYTDIYTMTRAGWAILRTNGWQTVTTAARLNALLPGRWRISFSRDGGLYHGGHLIVGFADGLAVNDETGDIGHTVDRWSNDVQVMLTAAGVAQAEEESQARRDHLADLRSARLAREHAKGEAGEYGTAVRYATSFGEIGGYVGVTRYHPRTWGGRHWACEACKAL